ncbi:MAG: hypothetical protein CMJ46_01900 [Planctomyces sp.]|nr:hypothetical protein [Planctomyces sp.]
MHSAGKTSLPLLITLASLLWVSASTLDAADYEIGLSKLEITPTEPVRLSGYGNRTEPFERVEEPIFVRTMAIRHGEEPVHILSGVEGIGLSGVVTKRIAERLEAEFGISRERFALANSHSHTAPHTSEGIPNLFAAPLSEAETAAMDRYTQYVEDQVAASVDQAIKALEPALLSWGEGASRLAMNRRIIKGGVCVGMGPNPDGIIDEQLPVLKVSSPDGELRGIIFNYACHCTTLVPQHNFVNGDWAGYAQKFLEEEYTDAIALCTIGCGADANPEPRGEFEHAIKNGRVIADEVKRVLKTQLDPIDDAPEASFGYAGLEYNRRDIEEFRSLLNDPTPQVRRHAENMVEVYERKRRLPETYPMPIQTWSFGDEMTMVFLGGEVVSPYAHRIRQELDNSKHTWVTAYANDVFGYVPSESMISQGGYEVDFSQVFYNHPGPWASGTEDLVLKRVKEIRENPVEGARGPADAVKTWKLPEGYEIELVASEPLIADPVNFNFGPDGRLWVAQMSDYPKGLKNEGIPGGQIRVLSDTDGDGKMDEAQIFLDGLSYPTGVMPWRKGAIISCAPDIFYAEDTDGDGQADHKQVLYTGFVESNPQHRVNGFAWGLDNWVHVGSGAPSEDITAVLTGKVINMSNLDIRIQPDTGDIETVSGRTQYGRVRDDWGNWFGSDNSKPIWHYVISDQYLRRNKFFPAPAPREDLIDPPVAPPVYPASRTVDRFNDLYAANRVTSACGEGIFRDVTLGPEVAHSAFVCEPVHNLVLQTVLEDNGATFKGLRPANETKTEFLASTDVWARPVRITTGPDGALWFADMYRHVIEHPQWIPDDWQKMLNVRAGEDKGRIYRVYRKGSRPQGPLPNLDMLDSVELAEHLRSTNGVVRDLAHQLLVNREDSRDNADLLRSLKQLALHAPLPVSRVQALCTLAGIRESDPEILAEALEDADWHVVSTAVGLSEPLLDEYPALGEQIAALIEHPEVKLKLQIALSLGEWHDPRAADALAKIGVATAEDMWMRAAVLSSSVPHAERMLEYVLTHPATTPAWAELVQHLVVTALGVESNEVATNVLAKIVMPENVALEQGDDSDTVAPWQYSAMGSFLDALERAGSNLSTLHKATLEQEELWNKTDEIFDSALELAMDEEADVAARQLAVRLLGRGLYDLDDNLEALAELLAPFVPSQLQIAAIDNLASSRNDAVPGMLLENWRGYSPTLQSLATGALLSRDAWTEDFLDALEEGTIAAVDLDPATRSTLTSLKNETLRARASQLLESTGSSDRTQIVEDYKAVAQLDGNPVRGSLVFRRACSACHQVREVGINIGPNIAALSDKSAANVALAVFDPNKAVEGQYRNYIVAMSDGRTFSGMIVAESSSSITLAENNGNKRTLLRTDIEELINTRKSFMPEGLEKDFSYQDFADLLAFIRSQPATTGASDTRVAAKAREMVKEATPIQIGDKAASPILVNHLGWFGEAKVAVSVAGSAATHVVCETMPIPADAEVGKPQVVLVPVAIKTTADPMQPFVLTINEEYPIEITPTTKDAAWSNEENGLLVRYMALESSGADSSGVLELRVPAEMVTPGESLKIKITATHPGNGEYIGIVPLP